MQIDSFSYIGRKVKLVWESDWWKYDFEKKYYVSYILMFGKFMKKCMSMLI